MKKRFLLSFIIILIAALAWPAASAFAAPRQYTTVNNAETSGYSLKGDIKIAPGVTVIGDHFCHNNDNITSVWIPKSVVSIGQWAFAGCRDLESITFESGSTLKYIRHGAFNGCAVTEFPALPGTVEVIEDYALSHMKYASFPDGTFTIPKSLRLIGDETETVFFDKRKNTEFDGGCNATHVFYNLSTSSSAVNLSAFAGESANYTAVDGVLYRKRSASDNAPVYLISIPNGKKTFDQFDYGDNKAVKGIYVMPNTVTGAAELSFNNGNKYLKKVILSDEYDIEKRPNDWQARKYNVTDYHDGICYANALTYVGRGGKNLASYGLRSSNEKYREYRGCIYSLDYSKLLAVTACAKNVHLHRFTSSIDSGALLNGRGFGTPFNISTGAPYPVWIENSEARSEYSITSQIAAFSYYEHINTDELINSPSSISEKINGHMLKCVLPNSNSSFKITKNTLANNAEIEASRDADAGILHVTVSGETDDGVSGPVRIAAAVYPEGKWDGRTVHTKTAEIKDGRYSCAFDFEALSADSSYIIETFSDSEDLPSDGTALVEKLP